MKVECEFESETLAAALQSRWPDRVDAQLRAHIESCRICSDVIAVAGAIDEAREELRECPALPDSGRVWWLAQLRARREAAEAAARPITAVHLIAFACSMGLLGACFGATSKWFQSLLESLVSSLARVRLEAWLPSALALLAEHSALILGMAAVVLLVPAAVYFAGLRD